MWLVYLRWSFVMIWLAGDGDDDIGWIIFLEMSPLLYGLGSPN